MLGSPLVSVVVAVAGLSSASPRAVEQPGYGSSIGGLVVLMFLLVLSVLAVARMARNKVQSEFRDSLLTFPIVVGLFLGLVALLFTPGLHGFGWVAVELIALGFFTIGLIVGFLFVVPKYADRSETTTQTGPASAGASLLPNTNLAKISDWLTTAITAITLSQLAKIPSYVGQFGTYLQGALPLPPGSTYGDALAVGLVAYFPALGAISGCIVTMLYIARAIRDMSEDVYSQGVRTALKATAPTTPEELSEGAASTPQSSVTRAIARDVARMPLSQLTTADDKAAWARAQATLGHWEDAVEGYKEALALKPDDPLLLQNYASALYNAEAPPKQVAEQYLKALPLVQSDTAAQARVLANLALTYLYIPGGFEQSLKYLDQILNDPKMPKDGRLYYYRACANGQKWAALSKSTPDAPQLQDIGVEIISDTKKALELRPELKDLFRMVSDPAERKDPKENDLERFAAQSKEFRNLIGMP